VGDAELVFCLVLSLLDLLLGERIHLVHIDELWHEREFCHWRYKSWRNLKERNRLQGSECFAVLLIWRRIDIPSLNKGEAHAISPRQVPNSTVDIPAEETSAQRASINRGSTGTLVGLYDPWPRKMSFAKT